MSEPSLVKIIFEGIVTGEYDEQTTKKRFQKFFRLEDPQIDRLFTGKPYTIKSNLSEDAALKLAFKIADLGCECSIEAMPDANDLSQQPGFVEQRKRGNRRIKYRRGPRPGAIVPDRRSNNGRRKIDPDPNADIYALD